MKAVTDPAILSQLNGETPRRPVSDPAILAQLNARDEIAEGMGNRDRIAQQQQEAQQTVYDVRGAVMPERPQYGFGDANFADLPFGDEVAAAGGALARYATGRSPSIGEAYETALDVERANREAYAQRNPGLSTASQVGAGLSAGASKSAAQTFFGRLGQGAGQGAALGGIVGFSEGEDGLADRAARGAEGAAWGAGLGAGASLGGELLGAGYRAGKNTVGAVGGNAIRSAVAPERAAAASITRALDRGGVTPDQAAARLARAEAAGSPMALVDVGGEATQRLARTVANVPGRGSEKINAFVEARKLDQPERVMDTIRTALGDPSTFSASLDDVIARRADAAAPLYEAAFAKPFQASASLQRELQTPAGQAALRRAQDLSANEGVPFALDVRGVDLVKRGLDDMIGSAKRAGENNQVRVLTGLRNRIVGEVDRAVPEYARARAVFSDATRVTEAMDLGRNAMRSTPDELRKQVAAMGLGEREGFRLGFARALADEIARLQDGRNLVTKLFGTQKTRDLVKAAFPDKKSFQQFRALMSRESAMARTQVKVRGNSTTAAQAADLEDFASAPEILSNAVQGNVGATARAVFGRAFATSQGINERVAEQLADMLTSRDPAVVQRALDVVRRNQGLRERFSEGLRAVQRATTAQGAIAAGRGE